MDNPTKISTLCGMALTILVNIQREDLVRTIILASAGGISSFVATLTVKYLIRTLKAKLRK